MIHKERKERMRERNTLFNRFLTGIIVIFRIHAHTHVHAPVLYSAIYSVYIVHVLYLHVLYLQYMYIYYYI